MWDVSTRSQETWQGHPGNDKNYFDINKAFCVSKILTYPVVVRSQFQVPMYDPAGLQQSEILKLENISNR